MAARTCECQIPLAHDGKEDGGMVTMQGVKEQGLSDVELRGVLRAAQVCAHCPDVAYALTIPVPSYFPLSRLDLRV